MKDYNNNGKIDGQDKALFHNEVQKESTTNNTNYNISPEIGERIVGWIINGVCLLTLSFIVSLGVVNTFTALLSLVCLARLGWSLFVAFINFTS